MKNKVASSTPSETAHISDFSQQIRQIQIEQGYKHNLQLVFVSPLAGLIVLLTFWSVVPSRWLWAWYAMVLVYAIIRLALSLSYNYGKNNYFSLDVWDRLLSITLIALGLVWGIGVFILWPSDSPLHQIVMPLIIIGYCGGISASRATIGLSYFPFVLITIGAVAIRFFLERTVIHTTLGIWFLICITLFYVVGRMIHKADTNTLEQGLAYELLAQSLAAEKTKIEQLNEQLAHKTEEVQESEERFRGLASATFEAVIIHDNGIILDSNPITEELFGYSHDELIGRHISEFLTAKSQQRIEALSLDTTQQPYEVEAVTQTGNILPVEVRAKTIPYQSQQAAVATIRDISERKQNEAHQQQITTLEERERIGRSLHDGLGQIVGYISLQSQTVSELLRQGNQEEAQKMLAKLTLAAQEAHDDLRHYILDIRTSVKSQIGFVTSLHQFVEEFQERYDFTIHLSLPDSLPLDSSSKETETQLLYTIQEALMNTYKHAGVRSARLLITFNEVEILIIIADDGCGFDPTFYELEQTKHFGLKIMRERIETAGGQLEIRSAPHNGTQVLVHMPLPTTPNPDDSLTDLRILLVDDHPLYLEGLRSIIETRDLQVVGSASDGLEAQELAQKLQPDLILMDIEMPHCDGIEATYKIKAILPNIKIVMLTVAADDNVLLRALKNGADGYLLKNLTDTHLFNLLTEVMSGEKVFSPSLATRLLTMLTQQDDPEVSDDTLPVITPRQQEVLKLIARGLSNKEISQQLHISQSTVKFHVGQILERLQLQNRREIARYAHNQDLLTSDDDQS